MWKLTLQWVEALRRRHTIELNAHTFLQVLRAGKNKDIPIRTASIFAGMVRNFSTYEFSVLDCVFE